MGCTHRCLLYRGLREALSCLEPETEAANESVFIIALNPRVPILNIQLGKQGSFQAAVCLFDGIWSPGERLGTINPLPCLLVPETGRHRAPWLTSFKMIEVGEKDRAPCPVSCGSLEEREVWGRMGPCVCMAESLHYSPEGITTLLISCVCVCAHTHAWSCQALCNPMDGSPSGFAVHGIIQARIPEWEYPNTK